ncbi:MAG: diguanylate cyclase [Mariprofundaceae bacterium]|nr:diguanylate cyclase [Mariprofundaceae bacterium]
MLVALLIIGGVSLVNLRIVISLSNEIVERSLTEIHHTMSLRLALSQVAMPVNDYIIRAVAEEQMQYQTLHDVVEQRFNTLEEVLAPHSDLYEHLSRSRERWREAKTIGNTIMTEEDPVGKAGMAQKMEQFDAAIDASIEVLNVLYAHVYHRTERSHDELLAIESRATTLVVALSLLGLAIAIIASIELARLFFPPLRGILTGVRRFGHGRFGYRIEEHMPQEFTELAEGFNTMAEKLEFIYDELKRSSVLDPLTGCMNRRKLDEDIFKGLSLARRTGVPLSLLMFDLDDFKEINDSYGHAAGDQVLKGVVSEIRLLLRKHETLYRLGGDEFMVMLPGADADQAMVLAERIRAAVGKARFDVGGEKPVGRTVSVGVSTCTAESKSVNELLKAADRALYMAKEEGRDRVHTAKR